MNLKNLSMSLMALFLLSSCGPSKEEIVQQKIQSLTEMAELGTVEYTVKKIIKCNNDEYWYKYGERKILFSSIAYLKAGIDMSGFTADNIVVDNETNSITATLPKAKLLSMNTSDALTDASTAVKH